MLFDVLPLIAIPAVVFAHWGTSLAHFRETGEARRFFSADHARMSSTERIVTLLGTLALIANLIHTSDRGDPPNGLVGGFVIIFSAYLFMDFYVGVRYRKSKRRG